MSTLARAGKTPADLPLALAVKDAFAPAGGATVTLIEPTSDRPSMRPPDPVAALPVLADIGRRGWTCWRDGADLLVNRRQDPPDDALADRIREHKPGILAVLDNLADAGVPRPEPGLLTDLADHYAEREAIMVIDGRVPEADAQRAAWAEALAVAVEPLVKGRGESV